MMAVVERCVLPMYCSPAMVGCQLPQLHFRPHQTVNSLSHQSAFIIEQLQLRFHNWIFHFGGGLLSSNRFLWEGFQPLPITDLLIPVLHFLLEIWGAAGQIFGTKMLSFWWFCLWWESQRSQKGFGMPEWLHLISKCRSTILKACH